MKKLFSKRYKRHYQESKIHLIIDLAFVLIILILITANIILVNTNFSIDNIEIKITRPQVNGEVIEYIKIENTDLVLNSNIVYYTSEGEQLGVGPWPPVTDEISSVRIIIDISSATHNVSDLQFLAKLPNNITWTNNSVVNTGNAIVYDNTNNLIVWNIGNWDAGQNARASFEIEFTPTQDNLGNKIKLLENLSVSGLDTITGQKVDIAGNNLFSPTIEE